MKTLILLACLMAGCTALGAQADAAALGEPTLVDGVITTVKGANYGLGSGLAAAWAAYQLLRKRTRTEWFNAGKALLPVPGDPSIRVMDAIKHLDNAVGGGHTSTVA